MTSDEKDTVNQYFVHTEAGWWDRIRGGFPKVHPVPPAANDDLQKYTDYENQIQKLRDQLTAFQDELQRIKADISAKDDEIKQLRQIDEDAIQKKELPSGSKQHYWNSVSR